MIGRAGISPSLEAIPESAVYDEYPTWTASEFLDKAQRRRKMLVMRRRRRYWGPRDATDLSAEDNGEVCAICVGMPSLFMVSMWGYM